MTDTQQQNDLLAEAAALDSALAGFEDDVRLVGNERVGRFRHCLTSLAARVRALEEDGKRLRGAACALLLFIDVDGKPYDGFRFRQLALELDAVAKSAEWFAAIDAARQEPTNG